MAEPEDKGRCVNCGFLAQRVVRGSRFDSKVILPAYYEIDQNGRTTGDVFRCVQNPLVDAVPAEPFCFMQAAELSDEVAVLQKGSGWSAAALEVFKKERNCESWYRYNPGLNPKDHFEQLNMELLEKSRREWEIRLETERKDFDLKLFEASQKIQESNRQIAADSYKTARRSFWFTLFSTFVIVILTLISLGLTLLQVWLAMRQSGDPIPFQEWFSGS